MGRRLEQDQRGVRFGGAARAAETVHRLPGVAIDGVVVANFAAVRTIVDAVSGIAIFLPYEVTSTTTGRRWPAGCHRLDDNATEDLVRHRHGVPGRGPGSRPRSAPWRRSDRGAAQPGQPVRQPDPAGPAVDHRRRPGHRERRQYRHAQSTRCLQPRTAW
ncbi:LCP family glycopolymer transferase [Micromonospora sp. SCSIO 07396]